MAYYMVKHALSLVVAYIYVTPQSQARRIFVLTNFEQLIVSSFEK